MDVGLAKKIVALDSRLYELRKLQPTVEKMALDKLEVCVGVRIASDFKELVGESLIEAVREDLVNRIRDRTEELERELAMACRRADDK